MHVQKNPFFHHSHLSKKIPVIGNVLSKVYINLLFRQLLPLDTNVLRKGKTISRGENEGVTVEQCCWCLEKKRWKESSSRKVEDNSSDWEGVTPFTIALLEFDCFSFALFPQGTRVAETNWTLAKATKPITSALYSPLFREWKAQELWLARITKGEGGKKKMESAD